MRRSMSILLAGVVAATSVASSLGGVQAATPSLPPAVNSTAPAIIPVEAEWAQQYRNNNRRWYHNRQGWDRGRGGWDNDNRYWNRRHGRGWDDDNGAAVALGLFGFAAGAMLGSQYGGGYGYGGSYGGGSCGPYDAHDRACDNRFRSYDWCSNTYMGYDGYRHYC